MKLYLDRMSEDTDKRLFEVADVTPYVQVEDRTKLRRRVFCPSCGRDYELGYMVVDFLGIPRCPSMKDGVECDGSIETVVWVRNNRHLASVKRTGAPAYPF